MQRPSFLQSRQATGRAYGKPATLITLTGSYNELEEWVTDPNPTRDNIKVSTEVGRPEDRDVRAGIAKKVEYRTFFTGPGLAIITTGDAGGDQQASRIYWDGVYWLVDKVGRWDWGMEVKAHRMDPQP